MASHYWFLIIDLLLLYSELYLTMIFSLSFMSGYVQRQLFQGTLSNYLSTMRFFMLRPVAKQTVILFGFHFCLRSFSKI